METPMRAATVRRPARVGFRPTPVTVRSEPSTSAAAAISGAADEKSAGTVSSIARRGTGQELRMSRQRQVDGKGRQRAAQEAHGGSRPAAIDGPNRLGGPLLAPSPNPNFVAGSSHRRSEHLKNLEGGDAVSGGGVLAE